MPRKPVLIHVLFAKPSESGEREVTASWTGTPESPYPYQGYIGTLRCTGEVGLRDDDGQAMYKWLLKTIPVDATFLAPSNDPADPHAARAAEKMVKAVYLAHGYRAMEV